MEYKQENRIETLYPHVHKNFTIIYRFCISFLSAICYSFAIRSDFVMKEKLQHFMTGRYGSDSFSRFLVGSAFACIIINMFTRSQMIRQILSFATLALLVYLYFRMFSRNCSKRYQENIKFMQIKEKVMRPLHKSRYRMQERKTNHIYTCPSCKQKIRIPKGKGRICITCPKCHTQFERKS